MIQPIQPIRRQARVPLLALVAVALAVVSFSLGRITTGSAARADVAVPAIARADVAAVQRPAVQAPVDKTGCGAGTYVSGDIAGDTSPAEVYATMCGKP